MKAAFHRNLKSALIQRQQISLPSTRWLITLVCICLVFYVLLALVDAPEDNRAVHFASEEGAITALSAVCLAMASGFAGVSFFLSGSLSNSTKYFWLLAALGFGFLALDELLGFHERVDGWITNSQIGPTQTFRNWNDVVVIGYGIGALAVISYFLPSILRYPKFAEALAAAFTFYCIHTAIDSMVFSPSSMSVILEETAKLFSSAFFAISMFIGLLGVVTMVDHPGSK